MKSILVILLLVLIASVALAGGLAVPMPQPQEHIKPTKFCHPSHSAEEDGMVWCNRGPKQTSCLSGGHYAYCKDGELMEETQICSSYCWKEWCKCCSILRLPGKAE